MSSSVSITNVYEMQPTFSQLGMGPVPAGITADAGVSLVQKQLFKNLSASWPATAPQYDPTQQDQGIMGPWTDNVGGTAPPCVVQAITTDFNAWSLPVDTGTVNEMAQQITQEISNNGGLTGQFFGKTRLGGSETLYWGVGYATGPIQDSPEVLGVIYVFAAVFGVNSARTEIIAGRRPPRRRVRVGLGANDFATR